MQDVPRDVKFRAFQIREATDFRENVWNGISTRDLLQNSCEEIPIRRRVLPGPLEKWNAVSIHGTDDYNTIRFVSIRIPLARAF